MTAQCVPGRQCGVAKGFAVRTCGDAMTALDDGYVAAAQCCRSHHSKNNAQSTVKRTPQLCPVQSHFGDAAPAAGAWPRETASTLSASMEVEEQPPRAYGQPSKRGKSRSIVERMIPLTRKIPPLPVWTRIEVPTTRFLAHRDRIFPSSRTACPWRSPEHGRPVPCCRARSAVHGEYAHVRPGRQRRPTLGAES